MGWLFALPPLLLLLPLVDLGLSRAADALADADPTGSPDKDTLDSLAEDIRQALGLRPRPLDMAKVNISQDEYSRMTALYLERVAARQKAALAEGSDELYPQRKLYTFHNGGGRARRAAGSPRRSPRTLLRMELPADAEVDQAEVRVFAREPGTLRVYEARGGGRRLLLAERTATAAGWTTLDVTSAARGAAGRPLLLDLRCPHCQDAALNVLAEPATHARARRAAKTSCGKNGQRCCRHTLWVDFAEIPDMGFIMQPQGFDAGLCRGRCPPRYHPAHHHSLIQGLLRHREQRQQRDADHHAAGGHGHRGARVPRPCCAPAKLQPLDVLVVDEDNPNLLKVSEWSEMKVLSCACA